MQISFILGIILAYACLSTAQQWPRRLHPRQQAAAPPSNEPCAKLAAIVNPLRAANPKGPSPTAPAELAFDCLNSVPLHKKEAMGVAGSLIPYARFQSDLAFKKNPPPGYQMKPVDIIGSLTKIVDNLTANAYPNEYAWQADTFRAFMSAKDGHLIDILTYYVYNNDPLRLSRFIGDLLAKVARFERRIGLVSVSMDGVGLPQVYMLEDINKTRAFGQSFKPSVVTDINGVEAVSFIESEADLGFNQDADTAYNTMFFSRAQNYLPDDGMQYGNFGGDSRAGLHYPGPNTTIKFANGSTLVIPTVARVGGNLTGITDGESVYQRFCTGPPKANPMNTSNQTAPPFTSLPSPNNVTVQGYPKAHVVSSDFTVSGYYLNGSAYKDVGVLAINSFLPMSPKEFQAVVQTQIAEMKRDGKNKLVIDLSVNGGGSLLQGYDTFRQLFPTIQDQSLGRFRIQPALTEMFESTAKLLSAPFDVNKASLDEMVLRESHYSFTFDRDANFTHFDSNSDKFDGPSFNGDKYSNTFGFDFNDPFLTTNETTGLGIEITGYGARKNFKQPFPPENIVMLYDGQCASTCTVFSEMMRLQANVKSISMGGRPSSKQIQAIGGTKGASDNAFEELFQITDFLRQSMADNKTGPSKTPSLEGINDLPINRSVDNALNMEDQILPANYIDGIPAQYIYEPADCRLFYTPPMVINIERMWEAAADVAFNGKSCVVGGISKGMGKRDGDEEKERKREMLRREEEMPRLRMAVVDARKLLAQARATKPLKRMKGWGAIHSKGIPAFRPEI